MAESRKLNGSKAWDGYYLSYAKGYLCDEVNHYKTLTYADESTYHIHAEQESQDEVLKSGFSLQKLVSTTGQPSPALKLEGAGFTVYRISKLSKTAQFKQNPDGSYNAQSILDAYRKDNYDNATLKYDFTAEGQAIANMFEGNTDTVNAYNATLTADGDYANGRGNGWMPTDQPAEYRLGEMFTNDEGIFRVEGLPYGQYLVVETTIPKDVFQCDPFIVTVDANSPQSRFTVPAGCVTTATNNYMTYNVLDEELEGYLQLIKTDTETGKAVKIANTAFALYRLDEKDRKTRISMIDPASGSATKKTDVFYTDADGLMKTPEKLPLGRYLIEELQGPEGYYNDPDYSVEFEIKSDRVWQVVGNATDDMDEYMDNTIAALRLFLLAVHSSNTQNIKSINAETINCFSTAMSNASEICMNVRRARCRQVGAYLHWLYDHKYTDLDYSLQLPNFKRTAPQIPQVWSPEEIDKILAVIDTANPVGRRNYAIFLLLARTGLRISDVLGLKFSNINWKENCISLSQQKTGNALSLPLSKELGMAIISYLQDGRPQSSSAFIFLSHNAPFQPLGEHNNFNPEFHKYLRRAGIAIPTKRHTGVHTIRHSFATNMLRKGTPVQDVSQILGHSNISVTENYLRVDIEHMRLCSLSLEGLL